MADNGIVIHGLNEFRAAARTALARYPTEIGKALKAAGVPIVAQASFSAPVKSGALAAGYSVSVSGTKASVISRVPYSGGAEWGTRGKFSGFNRYGAPPRFAGRAVQMQEPAIVLIVENELRDLIGIYGWAS